MTVYSYAQLEQLWINAGGAKSLAPIAAAIAEAESRGDSQATNPTDNNGTQTSWGLWQISDGTHNQPVANILDPAVNAAAAVAKYNAAGGWSPWGTYDSGAYTAFLSNSTPPDPNVPAGSSSSAALTSAQQSQQSAACLIGPFPHTSWCILSKSEARAMIGGMLMIAGGMIALPGLILLAAFAFRASGAAAAQSQMERSIPVYGPAVRAARQRARRVLGILGATSSCPPADLGKQGGQLQVAS